MTTAWAHLPNAQHIDWVLADLKAHPERWAAARDVAWGAPWGPAWRTAWGAATQEAIRQVAWTTASRESQYAAWDAVGSATRDAAWGAARDALLTLIAYDEAGALMNCSLEHLQRLYKLHSHPSYLLMQPLAAVRSAA